MAITSKSTLRDVLADPRAVAVIEEYVPGFVEEKADLLGPVLGMKINMLLKFPQAGFKKQKLRISAQSSTRSTPEFSRIKKRSIEYV